MLETIFNEINNCEDASKLFDLVSDYFQGQGFGSMAYIAPSVLDSPITIIERGMSAAFIARYREKLHRDDPLPRLAFRLARPIRLTDLIANLQSLNAAEEAYLEELKALGLSDTLILPSYGPFGRPAVVVLDSPAHPDLIDEMNIPLAAAVVQAMHHRMELLERKDTVPDLSPREREIVVWLCKGKSTADIATILGLKPPTVTTHIQRIYGKLHVHDRVSACAKAVSQHYV